ncbi:hypothetical protein KC571_02435, partial [candidate division WWE3 bacterium]|nr:hypothetical protein [candidate division WWE3 bacterium]
MTTLHPLFEGKPVMLHVSHHMGYGREMLVTPGISFDSGGLQVGIYAKIADPETPDTIETAFFW